MKDREADLRADVDQTSQELEKSGVVLAGSFRDAKRAIIEFIMAYFWAIAPDVMQKVVDEIEAE